MNKKNFFLKIKYFVFSFLTKIFLIFVNEKIYSTSSFSKIYSYNYLNKKINNLSVKNINKKYIILTHEVGNKINGIQSVASYVFRKFSFFKIRVTNFYYWNQAIFNNHNRLKKKNKILIDEPVFLLPYYNTHFGHYSGEILGLILLYTSLIPNNTKRKILIPKGSKEIDIYLKKFCSLKKIKFIKPEILLSNQVVVNNGVCLPVCHPWQNINYLKNKLIASFPYNNKKTYGVFLTSERSERIKNINEVVKFFLSNKFKIIKTNQLTSIETLSSIKNAKICVTEDATLSHFVMLHRTKKYFVFSIPDDSYSKDEYFGAYIFNEFDFPKRIKIKCELVDKKNFRGMSSKINVKIKDIKKIIINESKLEK